MATPKAPGPPTEAHIELTDPNSVREVFANRLAGINVSEGVVHVTLSVVRPKHLVGRPSNENVAALRFAAPISTIEAMVNAYAELKRAMLLAQQQKPDSKPN